MSGFDHSDIDGRLLQLLLAVVEERSVTRAAVRLSVTQSAVSHMLEKLRAIVADPIVVKAGRGVVPTARAEALAQRARVLLEALRSFATPVDFDPARVQSTLTIAANDLQRDLLLPRLLRRLRSRAPGLSLRVMPSGVPHAELLRGESCQLLVTPRPPDAADLLQRRLFSDRYRVFYDATARAAPRNLQDYEAAEHVTVVYEAQRQLDIDAVLAGRGVQRRFVVSVPGFSGIAPFLRGSELLATLPGLLRGEALRGFASVDVPVAVDEMPMYMVWHARHQTDPVHLWLRSELLAVVEGALAAAVRGGS